MKTFTNFLKVIAIVAVIGFAAFAPTKVSAQERTFSGHKSTVMSVSFSPDGKLVLSGSSGTRAIDSVGLLRLWDADTQKAITLFSGTSDSIVLGGICFTTDGKQFLACDGIFIHLFDITTTTPTIDSPKPTKTIVDVKANNKEMITAISFSKDRKQALTVHYKNGKEINLWDLTTGALIKTFSVFTDIDVKSFCFSPDGKQFLYSLDGGYTDEKLNAIKLVDIATGKEVRTFTASKMPIVVVSFSPDGKQFLAGSGESITLWDFATGKIIRNFTGVQFGGPYANCLSFSPDGKQALSGGADTLIKLWDVTTGKLIKSSKQGGGFTQVIFSPDGKQALFAVNNDVKIWDLK